MKLHSCLGSPFVGCMRGKAREACNALFFFILHIERARVDFFCWSIQRGRVAPLLPPPPLPHPQWIMPRRSGSSDDDDDGGSSSSSGSRRRRRQYEDGYAEVTDNEEEDEGQQGSSTRHDDGGGSSHRRDNEGDDEGGYKSFDEDEIMDADPSQLLEKRRKDMYHDPTCINNISRSLRVIPMKDAQVKPGRDGYCYFFTSMAEGPMLSSMALQQILVLLHVIHSYIPEECVLETDLLKPSFDKSGGLDKIMEKVHITDADWQREQAKRRQFAEVQLKDISG